MLTQSPSLTGMSNLVTLDSYQRSHCCLHHEAGVPGSYSHLLGENGCQWLLPWSKSCIPSPLPLPPVLFSFQPHTLVPKCPAYPSPSCSWLPQTSPELFLSKSPEYPL